MIYGIIDLMHSDPLYFSLKNDIDIRRESAKDILNDIEHGKIDAGMVSLVSFLRSKLNLVKTGNIHTLSNTISTVLISRKNHLKNSMEIGVTSMTETTSFYLSLILNKMNIKFKFKKSNYIDADNILNENDYALVIGDEALKVYSYKYNILMDIGYEFSRLYNLAPVYAVTASKYNLSKDDIDIINNGIKNSKNFVGKSIEKNRDKIKMNVLEYYYKAIIYDYNFEVENTINFIRNNFPNNI